MKLHFNKKYFLWGVTAFLVILASIIMAYVIFNIQSITSFLAFILGVLKPVIYGFVLAYLLNPILNWLEKKALPMVCQKMNIRPGLRGRRNIRKISVALLVVFVLAVLALFLRLVVPQLITSLNSLRSLLSIDKITGYMDSLRSWLDDLVKENPTLNGWANEYLPKLYSRTNEAIESALPYVNQIASSVTSGILKSLSFLMNLILGLIFAVYILLSKEHFLAVSRKMIFAFSSEDTAQDIIDEVFYINNTFNRYIISSIVDSFLIGMICFIACMVLQIPYPVLVSLVVGITNIIPFFGPFMGGVPCALIILIIDPIKAVYFAIMIVVLQQCDGNIIKPKLFGDSMGLSGFWVLTAILVGGGLFGVPGMYLGTPICAIIYYEIGHQVNKKLAKRGLSTNTDNYLKADELPLEDKNSKKKANVIKHKRGIGERKKLISRIINKIDRKANKEDPEKEKAWEGNSSPSDNKDDTPDLKVDPMDKNSDTPGLKGKPMDKSDDSPNIKDEPMDKSDDSPVLK
ncbi:MAG: AI-2E family transporter [Lachnospiraceae bacterium]|nr:AI-2E family transporter [Lachnospiraceae bacterium]